MGPEDLCWRTLGCREIPKVVSLRKPLDRPYYFEVRRSCNESLLWEVAEHLAVLGMACRW